MKKAKTMILSVLLATIVGITTSCFSQGIENDKSSVNTSQPTQENGSIVSESDYDNPFESNENNTMVLGALGHGFANPKLDENGTRLPMQYNGGELKIDYYVQASGTAKNVGFLIFIDGIAQPYKYNSTDVDYEYMHILELEEDDKQYTFSFIFTPVTGVKGDTLSMTITSIYNPAFIPDMKETTGYGGYQITLDATNKLIFKQDAAELDSSTIQSQSVLQNVVQTPEPITQDFLEKDLSTAEDIDINALNTDIYTKLYFDNKDIKFDSNLQIKRSGTLHVTFKIVGHPGVKYQNTFYINHQALTDGQGVSFETTLTKGEISVLEADIDLSKIENFNTFYVISTPCNAEDYPDDVIVLEKTSSVLLYKE